MKFHDENGELREATQEDMTRLYKKYSSLQGEARPEAEKKNSILEDVDVTTMAWNARSALMPQLRELQALKREGCLDENGEKKLKEVQISIWVEEGIIRNILSYKPTFTRWIVHMAEENDNPKWIHGYILPNVARENGFVDEANNEELQLILDFLSPDKREKPSFPFQYHYRLKTYFVPKYKDLTKDDEKMWSALEKLRRVMRDQLERERIEREEALTPEPIEEKMVEIG